MGNMCPLRLRSVVLVWVFENAIETVLIVCKSIYFTTYSVPSRGKKRWLLGLHIPMRVNYGYVFVRIFFFNWSKLLFWDFLRKNIFQSKSQKIGTFGYFLLEKKNWKKIEKVPKRLFLDFLTFFEKFDFLAFSNFVWVWRSMSIF